MTIHAAVFFRDKLEMTARLVNSVDDAKVVHLFDNGSVDDIVPLIADEERCRIYRRPGAHLTGMWNEAWDSSLFDDDGPVDLAILNNDITVPAGFLTAMAEALRSDPDLWAVAPDSRDERPAAPSGEILRVTGPGKGAMAGWAFMVRAEMRRHGLRSIDEQFEWWYGDNDVADLIVESGHSIGLIVGLGCEHEISATWREHPELHQQANIDGARYRARRQATVA